MTHSDAVGNITEITQGTTSITYEYDAANRLIRENNGVTNQTIVYDYTNDLWGNIQSKTVYPYTTATNPGTPTGTNTYTYGNTDWGDRLTSYNGQTFTYDSMGNPTSYRGYTFGWRGKQLTSASNGTNTLTFEYNEDGLRQSKTCNNITTDYYYNGSVLIGMQRGQTKYLFSYDAGGNVVSVKQGDNEYYYLRNAQGDIVKLIDASGAVVVEYTYDTWGKKVTTTGSLAGTLGLFQPFRYRGYVYDWETGFYYLQSRYYDPTTGRFISADVLLSTGQGVLGHNCYAYCLGNPVNKADSQGSRAVIGFDPNKDPRGSLYEEFCSNDDVILQRIAALTKERYSYSSWLACRTNYEKDKFVKNYTNDIADIMGVGEIVEDTCFDFLTKSETGAYCYDTKIITIDAIYLSNTNEDMYIDLLKTVVHECRHAYQSQYADMHTNSLSELMKKEFKGFGTYEYRLIEKDAFAFETKLDKMLRMNTQ